MGFADGFATGFGLMERQQQRLASNDRAKRLDEQSDQRYQDSLNWRNTQAEKADSRYQDTQARLDRAETTSNERHQDSLNWRKSQAETQQKNSDRSYNLQQQRLGMERETHNRAIQASDYRLQQQQLNDVLTNLSAGAELDDKSLKVLQDANVPLNLLAGDSYQKAKETFAGVMQGSINYNDPAVHDLMTQVLGPRIMERNDGKGRDGSKITNIQVNKVVPLDGERMAFGLQITTESGDTYSAPMTEKGSAKDDDKVQGIKTADLMDAFDNVIQLSEYAKANPGLPAAVKGYMVKTGRAQPATIGAERQAQIDYLKDQLEQTMDLMGSDSVMPEERQAYQEKVDVLRKQLSSMLNMPGQEQPPAPELTPEIVAGLNSGKIIPERFIEVFGQDAYDQHYKSKGGKSDSGQVAGGQQPADQPPAAAGIQLPRPKPAQPIPVKPSSVGGLPTIDFAARKQQSEAQWNARPRGEVMQMAEADLRLLAQKSNTNGRWNQRQWDAGLQEIIEDLGLSQEEIAQLSAKLEGNANNGR